MHSSSDEAVVLHVATEATLPGMMSEMPDDSLTRA